MSLPLRSVLISDEVDPLCVELLKKHNIPVTCKYKLPKEELLKEIQKHDGLIVRSDTKVTADVIAAAPNLSVIGRAGTGVDNIDLEAATNKGIIVLNTPGGNSISACELTCSLMANLARNVSAGCQSLKEGRWDRKLYSGSELQGKTLAILGLGRIGKEVAIRMQAFGMRTIGFDPIVSKEDAAAFNVEKMELSEIWPIADYITVHTPLIPQTRNMINDSVFSKCKRGVRVINVARGGIICEEGLLKALQDGRCGGAALDVFAEEPPKAPLTRTLIEHPKVVATPHLGASTSEAQMRVAVEVAEQFVALCDPNAPYAVTGPVNAPLLAAQMQPRNVPWIELSQALGRLAGQRRASTEVRVQTAGESLQRVNFLATPLASGILAASGHSANLVNALVLAKREGLTLVSTHDDKHVAAPCIRVTVGGIVLTGAIGDRGAALLQAVDDAVFPSGSAALIGEIKLFKVGNPTTDIASIVAAAAKTGVRVINLSVAVGSSVWVFIRTEGSFTVNAPGVEAF